MPSLHKRTRSPFWVAAYTAGDGRRLKKSTKTSDRSLALKMALEWEKAAKAGRAGRLVESQLRRVLSEIHEQANGEPLHFHTASAWLNEWLDGKKGVSTERTVLKYQQIIGEFISHTGEKINAPLGAISPRDVRSFRDAQRHGGRSPATVNGALKILATPFNSALRLGYISTNPCAGVEMLRDDADVEKDVFTSEQVCQLIVAAEGDWKGAILVGFYTGFRLRDVVDLRWGMIDLEGSVLRVKTGKTGAVVHLPLHSELAEWLFEQTRGIGNAPVFPALCGKTGGGKSGLSNAFRRIMERAGIVGRVLRQRKPDGAGRTQSSLSFHSLRHSFNSALANAGVAQEVRQKLTGHASKAMNTKYTHHEIDKLREAVAMLPNLRIAR
jgi:integrase